MVVTGDHPLTVLAEGDGDPVDDPLELLISEVRGLREDVQALIPERNGAEGAATATDAPRPIASPQHRRLVDRLVCESALPAAAVTEHFVRTLLECSDEASVRCHLDDRCALVRRLGCRTPSSRERAGDLDLHGEDRRAEQALVEAVRDRPAGVLGVL